jgi:hypothetical protein
MLDKDQMECRRTDLNLEEVTTKEKQQENKAQQDRQPYQQAPNGKREFASSSTV